MINISKGIVKNRIAILIISIVLLIPSIFGYINTRINYDMLNYLPDTIDTMKGQQILLDDFGKGAFSIVMVEGMDTKEVSELCEQYRQIDHVDTVLWYDSIADCSIPIEMLPDDIYDFFNKEDCTMMAIFFDTGTSADETMEAITQIRSTTTKNVYVTGMSAMVTDLKELCEQEESIYVAIAVALSALVMMFFLDSWILPLIFLASIGIAILWNLGTNYFFGEISYITKALAAVLQLAVTMDYSIFLWHSFLEMKEHYQDSKEAMAQAITHTFTSVLGSSTTTIGGFLALCFMTFTLGKDLGIVMAKGVLFGVVGCVTVLPALILTFEKLIDKTRHKPLMPDLQGIASFITNHYIIFLVIFAIIAVPAVYGYQHTETYYDLGSTLPDDLQYCIATKKLDEEFNMGATHMILADVNLSQKDTQAMMDEISQVDGVNLTMGLDTLIGDIPEEMIPDSIKDILTSDEYQLLIVGSEYKTASDEVNEQCNEIQEILNKYDEKALLIGEAPCTRDLIDITNTDFTRVNWISIAITFAIIAVVLQSASLPFILIAVIEFAIFINLGLPYYTNTVLPFIGPICISTIQLGATVDYAILTTTRYKLERSSGKEKKEAIQIALGASMPSIIVSAIGFFAATFGVALYSDVDIIGSLCSLMARGALISMASVICVLPSFLMIFDGLINKTTFGMRKGK